MREGGGAGGTPLSSPRGRALVTASVCGSAVAFLDASVVNVALPTIGRDLGADLGALQWTVSAYTLVLASLILLGGSLGDRLGRRRVFVVGVTWFAAASLLCALAPSVDLLVAARALQGVGGALLTPTSLALLQAELRPQDRARAIGAWSGATTLVGVGAPLLGGALVALDWRWVFAVNLPVAALAVGLVLRALPAPPRAGGSAGAGSGEAVARAPLDLVGAGLGALALGAATWALITAGGAGASPPVVVAAVAAAGLGAGFVVRERRAASPLVPLSLFADRTFAATNAFTLLVYAALGGLGLLLTLQLQVGLGYSALRAGAASLPSGLLLGLLSGRSGALGQRLGPSRVLTAGALTSTAGFAWLSAVGPGSHYLTGVLPGVVLFGLGAVLFVAPLTASVLAAAPVELAGAASGVNNAVARTAGLLAVAALPALAGIGSGDYTSPTALTPGYRTAMLVCAGLTLSGAVVAACWVPPGRLVLALNPRGR